MTKCGLEKGMLVNPGTVLSDTLGLLCADLNKFGREDVVACAAMRLRNLTMKACDLNESDLEPLSDEKSVAKDMLTLVVFDNNRFATSDALSKLKLTHLSIEKCEFGEGDIAVLLADGSKLTETLTLITVAFTKLNDEDMRGIYKLSNLSIVSFKGCGLGEGSLGVFETNQALMSSLRHLIISQNTFGIEDFRVIKEMSLTSLDVSHCTFKRDAVDLLDSSKLTSSFGSLNLSGCVLSKRALAAITRMPLKTLQIAKCGLGKGSLAAFAVNSSVIAKTLKDFVLTNNHLSVEDIKVLAQIPLECLKINYCNLPGGSLVLIVNSVLNESLYILHAWVNALKYTDYQAVMCLMTQFLDLELADWVKTVAQQLRFLYQR